MPALPIVLVEGTPRHRLVRLVRAVLVVVLVVALPYVVASYQLSQITGALILGIAVVGLNLLSGFGGQISLGHAAFFGLGAYTTAVLQQKASVAVPLGLLCGILLCFVVGVVVGLPALRLRGTYLALVTLAVGVVFPSLVRRFDGLAGGSAGLFGLQFQAPDIAYFSGRTGQGVWLYWAVIVALGLSCLAVHNIMRSRTGRSIIALRDNQSAAVIMGVNRTVVRTVLFGISAGIAGLAGGLFAVNAGVITPDSFSLLLTLNLLVAMVLGGSASFWGPIVGGFAIYFVPLWSSDLVAGPVAGVLFGVVVIVTVFGMRSGLVGVLTKLGSRLLVVRPSVSTGPQAAVPGPGEDPPGGPGEGRGGAAARQLAGSSTAPAGDERPGR